MFLGLGTGEAWHKLGYSFPTWRKWQILGVFLIQISINMNASMYANGVSYVSEEYGVSKQVSRIPQMAFLVAYGFVCELWAPWSEETLGGLSTAGGSVVLGVLADMWKPDEQEYAVALWCFPALGVGGFVEEHLSLPWIFWVQLIVGRVVPAVQFVCNPETRSTILLDCEVKRRRKTGEDPNIYGPNEMRSRKMTFKEFGTIFGRLIQSRPFYIFFTELIFLWLSLLSRFSDALIFTFLQSFQPVYEQWGFGTVGISLAFIHLLLGYIFSYLSYLPSIHHLLFLAPLETIGLFGLAWTSLGPDHGVPWIATMIFSCMVGIANYTIYQSSIDYQTAAYGPYAASATGGNDLARDFLGGIAALYSAPMYENIPGRPLEYASTILACLAILVTIPIYVEKSRFAQSLDKSRTQKKKRRKSSLMGVENYAEREHLEKA
ncbi:MFS general substrate transporter [Corynespora cassiicola Philippines]|uniref:MFS general substrate transporter n=1 Tax=Corynespora cassiicola Philippines TaxID=1448308 RepID=A0A2T2P0F4_CORCC|nr:MFS general substrate transporter [Corynespora cassiicola Philippines]